MEKLTNREKTCLTLAANGMTTKEAAEFLGLKRSTVEYYNKNIKYKLNSKTIANAVFKGISIIKI